MFGLLIFEFPAIPAILIGILSAIGVAVVFQGQSIVNTVSAVWGGYHLVSDNKLIETLFSRGGISSMTGTAVLIIFSFGLFGILKLCNVLDVLVVPLTKKLNVV